MRFDGIWNGTRAFVMTMTTMMTMTQIWTLSRILFFLLRFRGGRARGCQLDCRQELILRWTHVSTNHRSNVPDSPNPEMLVTTAAGPDSASLTANMNEDLFHTDLRALRNRRILRDHRDSPSDGEERWQYSGGSSRLVS
jgi:hypothetical protein